MGTQHSLVRLSPLVSHLMLVGVHLDLFVMILRVSLHRVVTVIALGIVRYAHIL